MDQLTVVLMSDVVDVFVDDVLSADVGGYFPV